MANPYVILTNKDGQFRTEIGAGLLPVAQYDYFFYGQRKARFVIAELQAPVRIALVEEQPPHVKNWVPSKFFPSFDSVAAAREDLQQLVAFGALQTELKQVPLHAQEAP